MNIKNVVKATAVTATLLGGVALAQPAVVNADTTNEVWGIGDSTIHGYDGHTDVTPLITTVGSDLGEYSNNYHALSGASIQTDMPRMVQEFNRDKYHTRAKNIIVNYGLNDFNYYDQNLNNVSEEYRARLSDLKWKNPQATLTAVLPAGSWLGTDNQNTVGKGGYTMNQLRAQIKKIAKDMNINVVDMQMIVNDSNHTWKLGDGIVHPTASTYVEYGHAIANAIKAHPNNNSVYTPYTINRLQTSGYVNTLGAGWRWLENGKAYTGFRYYMGAYYYFDKGVRQENKWVSQWGLTYYVNDDGRSVQGTRVIKGKTYNFGNNGTFYLR